jgi:hypothetical protein
MTLKEKWIAALRSGRYKQGQGKLRSMYDKYCCLGVLCDVVDPLVWKLQGHRYVYQGLATSPPAAIEKEAGLCVQDISFLMKLNDKEGKSFHEIADYIEENL